jgi:serine/threonine protein kinase
MNFNGQSAGSASVNDVELLRMCQTFPIRNMYALLEERMKERNSRRSVARILGQLVEMPGVNLFRLRKYAWNILTTNYNGYGWDISTGIQIFPSLHQILDAIRKSDYKTSPLEAIADIQDDVPYKLIRKIGEGAQSLVYEAENGLVVKVYKRLDDKDILDSTISRSSWFPVSSIVQRRIAVAERVQDPAILPIISTGTCLDPRSFEQTQYIVTPLIQGVNLEDYMHEINFEPVGDFLDQTLRVVQAVHEIGYYQLDLRLPNILLQNGQIYLSDLETLTDGNHKLEADHDHLPNGFRNYVRFKGASRSYMDPQMRSGELSTPSSDLYAAAACALHLLLKDTSIIFRLNQYKEEEYNHVFADTVSVLPHPLSEFFEIALAYQREHRYSSALEMRKAARCAFTAAGVIYLQTLSRKDIHAAA